MGDLAAGQPTTTPALLVTAPQRLVMRPVPLPPLGARDLRIRVALSAVSPTDEWPRMVGAFAHLPGCAFPFVPGDGAVGSVVATGAAVDRAWQGAAVFVGAASTAEGIRAARGVQQASLVAPVDAAIRLDGLEPERALFIAPVAAALHNLERAGMASGARLVALGQGLLGQMVARVFRSRGAAHITVADASARRLARSVADRAVHLPDGAATRVDCPQSVDLIVDTTGDAALVRQWTRCLRPGGTLLLLGWYPRFDLAYLQGQGRATRVVLAAEPDRAAYATAQAMLRTGEVDTVGLDLHRFGVERAAQAYAVALGDPDAAQVCIVWE